MIAWEKRDRNLLWRTLEDGTVLLFVYDEPHAATMNILYKHEWTPQEWAALIMGAAAGDDNEDDYHSILALHLGHTNMEGL